MPSDIHFLPWMRSGLGLGIGTREPDTLASLPEPAAISGHITINDSDALADLSIRPPHHVTAIDTSQIARRYPGPNITDAEYGYFPHIEFLAPDLPWAVSPHAADETNSAGGSTGRLRPWIVLVCFDAALGLLSAAKPDAPQELTIDASELPELGECWAWAHVQSTVIADDAAAAAETPDGRVLSRLVCPRRLEPATRYRAALVNAWAADGDGITPAWSPGAGGVSLKVYVTWTFSTGLTGSFEDLVERLSPVPPTGAVYGLTPMDVSRPGMIPPPPTDEAAARADYVGALNSAGAEPDLTAEVKESFDTNIEKLLNRAGTRQDTKRGDRDPVVSLPYYGSFPTGASGVPNNSWLRELNLLPQWRAAAGLGAEIVQRHQERFMAQAWDQVGQLREANRMLNRAALRRTSSETWKRKAMALDPAQALGVLRPQLTFLRDADTEEPLRTRLMASSVPNGMVSPAMARALRPSGVVQKTLTAPLRRGAIPGDEPVLARRQWRTMLRDTLDTADARDDVIPATPRAPSGIRLAAGPQPQAASRDPVVVSDMSKAVRDTLNPVRVARRQVEFRVPAMAGVLSAAADDSLPTRVTTGPSFNEALSVALMAISPELLMPGIGEVAENSTMLVEANPAFAAGLLAGANHEMARELLWREYPADLAHTSFRRFWARPDPDAVDIEPMNQWDLIRPLDWHGQAGGESVVLVVRGDVIRHFPSARFLLVDPDVSTPMAPSFTGRIPPDIGFFGFDVPDASMVTAPDSEWLVIIEEPNFEPRFGLDTGPGSNGTPTTYRELAWDDLQSQEGPHLAVLSETQFEGNTALEQEADWGLNGAHMAKITHQQPVRWLCRAVDLLGGGQ